VPKNAQSVFAAGEQNDVPILTGWNAGDGVALGPPVTAEKFRKQAAKEYGDLASQFLKIFPADSDQESAASQNAASRDQIFAWQSRTWARMQSKTGKSRVFLYYFDRSKRRPLQRTLRAVRPRPLRAGGRAAARRCGFARRKNAPDRLSELALDYSRPRVARLPAINKCQTGVVDWNRRDDSVVPVGRTKPLEGGEIDQANAQFSGQEAMIVIDDVFVPNELVFMDGETEFAAALVERFTAYHRRSYVCKTGLGDVIIGAAALIADYNGAGSASHVRDELVENGAPERDDLRGGYRGISRIARYAGGQLRTR
jgi:4-hydroxyphenylacetate 3-hydroxylase C terminal